MGGTWKTQNKRRPGAYINVIGAKKPKQDTSLGRTLLINSVPLNWGPKGIIELDQSSDFRAQLGAPLNTPDFAVLRETLKGALTVLLLNNNDGQKAQIVDAALPWKFIAKYPGTNGNKLHISIEKDTDSDRITISTIYGTEIVDQQVIRPETASHLQTNNYIDVEFVGDMQAPVTNTKNDDDSKKSQGASSKRSDSKLASLPTSSTYNLSGGTSQPVTAASIMNNYLETEVYNVATTAGFNVTDPIHQQLVEEIQHLREDEGYKVRGVVPSPGTNDSFNYEGISVVANGVELNDGTKLDETVAAGYFAGASSAAAADKSLTYSEYPDAIAAYPKFNNEQTIRALDAGEIVFTTKRGDRVVVEQDINSLIKFTDNKPQEFSKNRIIRSLDTIVTDTEQTFENSFLGKVNNDSTGRDLFKANRVSYLQKLNDGGVIEDFKAEDISVEAGNDKDAILVNLAVKPLDAMEKLYMTMVVG
ncbi:phage tail protein [Bombilactobacillus bombi]|uniref:Phage tail protein n=1 Tax=Bombilactobacillus bombi TaxID=1303590 RepID=A0A417ZEJ9_9LACO|nr:phage tail sheath family protein [Bombilactobacillus bombi]RHW49720.1 phage tail protein [Bombilactobacillus bombi]